MVVVRNLGKNIASMYLISKLAYKCSNNIPENGRHTGSMWQSSDHGANSSGEQGHTQPAAHKNHRHDINFTSYDKAAY